MLMPVFICIIISVLEAYSSKKNELILEIPG